MATLARMAEAQTALGEQLATVERFMVRLDEHLAGQVSARRLPEHAGSPRPMLPRFGPSHSPGRRCWSRSPNSRDRSPADPATAGERSR